MNKEVYAVYFHNSKEPAGKFSRDENGRYLFFDDPKGIIGHIFSGKDPDKTFELLKHSLYYRVVPLVDMQKYETLEKEHPLKFKGQDPRSEMNVMEVKTPRQRKIMAKQLSEAFRRSGSVNPKPMRDKTGTKHVNAFNRGSTGINYNVTPKTSPGTVTQLTAVNVPKEHPGTRAHEALHRDLTAIGNAKGESVRRGAVTGLLAHLHPEDYKNLRAHVKKRGYKFSSPRFEEEMLAHLGQILTSSKARSDANFNTYAGFGEHPRLKAAYKRMQQDASAWDPNKVAKGEH